MRNQVLSDMDKVIQFQARESHSGTYQGFKGTKNLDFSSLLIGQVRRFCPRGKNMVL
jgi:hypothetical protein